MNYIQSGTKEYKLAKLAFLIGGFVTFSLIYAPQPTMPIFVKEFNVSASHASLTLSLTTGLLSISMLAAAILSDKIGMKRIMVYSMMISSVLGILSALSPNFTMLLLSRFLLGIFVAGIPAIAMAFIGREFNPMDSILIMSFYISGTSIGGMLGRILTGLLTDLFTWRISFALIGFIALLLSFIFLKTLPNPKTHVRKAIKWSTIWASYKIHLMNKQVCYLYILGFLLMGSYVSMFNYIGFLLVEPPYHLSQTIIGSLFIVNLCGTFSSIYMGKKVIQYGSSMVLKISLVIMIIGSILTLLPSLLFKIIGLAILTFGFFACHAIISSLVTKRVQDNKAQASSLYLFFYYLGSSVVGTFSGYFWESFAWIGVIALIVGLLAIGLILVFINETPSVVSARNKDKGVIRDKLV